MAEPRFLPAPDAETQRISLRRRRDGGALSDVLGHLVAANDEWMVVLPEDRAEVWVPRGEVESVRKVPERVVLPASDADGLERVLDRTWPGLRRARLGGWILRAGRGVTGRANSALAVGDPELPFEEAAAAVERWSKAPAKLQAVVGGRPFEEALAAGFVAAKETVVMIRDATQPGSVGYASSEAPDEAWIRLSGMGEDQLAEVTAAPASCLRISDVAIGRVSVADRWAVLSCIEVAESARGLGHGRAMLHALIVEASRLGARHLGLQVEASNTIARTLYDAEGFTEHHRYAYLSRP